MPYATYELSQYDGEPVELFLFADDVAQNRWAVTTGEDALVDGLVTYRPGIINRTSVSQAAEIAKPIEIKVPASSDIAQQFKAYLPARPISLVVQRYHANDEGVFERVTVFIGQVTTVAFETDGMATLNCQPVTKAFQRKVPWQVYKGGCNWALYGYGCFVPRILFATPAGGYTLSGVTLVSSEFAAHPDGWFNAGYIEVPETGEQRFVVNHVGNTITLNYPFFGLPPGAPLVSYAGCDRTKETCRTKFNNNVNRLGWDWIPGDNPYDLNFSPGGGGAGGGGGAPGSIFDIIDSLAQS